MQWDPESSPGFWVNRASRLMVRRADASLRPLGFALTYLPVLRALAMAGRPLSQSELAQRVGVEQPTMAETLPRMVRDGLVRREPNPADKRAALVSITRLARARFPKARVALADGEREALAGLSSEEKTLLKDLLKRVVGNLEAGLPVDHE